MDILNNALPTSWFLSSLGDVTTKPQYGWTTKAANYGEKLKLLRTSDITSGRVNWQAVPTCVTEPNDPEKYFLKAGDIVVARAGSVGKSFLIKENVTDAVFASYLVRFTPQIEPEYIDFFMQSRRYWEQIEDKSSGIAIPNVNASKLSQIEIPVAPLNEQRRIIEKIETLFSRLDKGEETLRDVQKLLVRYRQSVLKSAVTGQLTTDWRAENAHRLEHGRDLLTRILQTRRETWEGRGKYKEPVAPDTTGLPELPEGWVWANGSQLFSWSSGKFLPNKSQTGGGIPVYGGNGVNGYHNCALVDEPTMVVGRVGAHCGNVHLTIGPAWVTDNAIYATQAPSFCNLRYLVMIFRNAKLGEKSKGGAQPFVNQEALNSTLIPLPPPTEQEEIMARVDAEFANSGVIEESCKTELTRSTALRQSILKDAFAGRLVPQDPSDEPASELLARIRAARGGGSKKRGKQ
ncbi:restriction endonuclease subunit S [Desulfonatronum lacustre]|uniref:restriction endonuclease subunit S n=1 Tax=Desulfonatronum lacustre TaxID=66849 RepID=UPI00048C6C7C|nr:restriction endonuclease subunit S [Desulfonatronum lacustre]